MILSRVGVFTPSMRSGAMFTLCALLLACDSGSGSDGASGREEHVCDASLEQIGDLEPLSPFSG